jgi:hypothetical protein
VGVVSDLGYFFHSAANLPGSGRVARELPSAVPVFCTTALFVWKLDPTDVSRMAGHANYRITLEMYVGAPAGVLDRARQATD